MVNKLSTTRIVCCKNVKQFRHSTCHRNIQSDEHDINLYLHDETFLHYFCDDRDHPKFKSIELFAIFCCAQRFKIIPIKTTKFHKGIMFPKSFFVFANSLTIQSFITIYIKPFISYLHDEPAKWSYILIFLPYCSFTWISHPLITSLTTHLSHTS